MPNKRRKEVLDRRARQYASTRLQDSTYPSGGTIMELANAYQRGYRDAMSDLRKVLARTPHDWEGRNATDAVLKFLRPLR